MTKHWLTFPPQGEVFTQRPGTQLTLSSLSCVKEGEEMKEEYGKEWEEEGDGKEWEEEEDDEVEEEEEEREDMDESWESYERRESDSRNRSDLRYESDKIKDSFEKENSDGRMESDGRGYTRVSGKREGKKEEEESEGTSPFYGISYFFQDVNVR